MMGTGHSYWSWTRTKKLHLYNSIRQSISLTTDARYSLLDYLVSKNPLHLMSSSQPLSSQLWRWDQHLLERMLDGLIKDEHHSRCRDSLLHCYTACRDLCHYRWCRTWSSNLSSSFITWWWTSTCTTWSRTRGTSQCRGTTSSLANTDLTSGLDQGNTESPGWPALSLLCQLNNDQQMTRRFLMMLPGAQHTRCRRRKLFYNPYRYK